jgi:hypothetical protein
MRKITLQVELFVPETEIDKADVFAEDTIDAITNLGVFGEDGFAKVNVVKEEIV